MEETKVMTQAEETKATPKKRGRKPKAVQVEQPVDSAKTESIAAEGKKKEDASVLSALMKRNAIEGFNPYDGVVAFPQEDGSTKFKMPAVVAMQWFLAKYPNGRAVVTVNQQFCTPTFAVFDCQLYDGDTPFGFPGSGSCGYSASDELHRNFVQSAQTKAIACALRNNGFCAPYDCTDGPLMKNGEDVDNEKNVKSSGPSESKEVAKNPENVPVETSKKTDTPIMVDDDDAKENATEGDKAPVMMDIQQALNFIVPFGPSKGKTMKEVVESKGCAAIRYFTGQRYMGQPVYLAAKAVCTFYNG